MNKTKEKMKLIVISSAIIVIVILAVFLIKQKNKKEISLFDYMPEQTDLAYEVDLLSINKIGDWQLGENDQALENLKSFLFKQGLPEVIWHKRDKLKSLAFFGWGEKTDFYSSWLIETDNVGRDMESWAIAGYYLSIIDNNIILLSKDIASVAIFKEAKEKEIDYGRLATSHKNDLKIKIKSDWLKKNVANKIGGDNNIIKFWPFKKNIWLDLFFNIEQGKIICHFYADVVEQSIQNLGIDEDQKEIIMLPMTEAIVINNIRLAEIIDFLFIEWQRENSDLSRNFINFWQANFIDEGNNRHDFFNQDISLVVQPLDKIVKMSDPLLMENYNWVIVLKNNIPDNHADQQLAVKKFIHNYLAVKNPIIKESILPDGTHGREVVVGKDSLTWEKDGDYNNLEKISDKLQSIFLFYNQEITIIGNNKYLVLRTVRNHSMTKNESDNHQITINASFDPNIFSDYVGAEFGIAEIYSDITGGQWHLTAVVPLL